MFAEATIVPGTVANLQGICLYMKVLTIFIIAFPKLLIEVADWHLAHVILMKEFTVITLLAQVTKPVLADYSAFSTNMAKWTVTTTTASAIQKELA